jgi:hypothetical protein
MRSVDWLLLVAAANQQKACTGLLLKEINRK